MSVDLVMIVVHAPETRPPTTTPQGPTNQPTSNSNALRDVLSRVHFAAMGSSSLDVFLN